MKQTLQFLRDRGITARKTEQWVKTGAGGFRRDLFHGDAIAAIGTDLCNLQLGISAHHADKVKKALIHPEVRTWLQTRNKFLVWTWAKRAAFRTNGKRKLRDEYRAKITEIRLSDDKLIAVPFELL